MDPFEYVAQYHDFAVDDARLGLSAKTTLHGYNNRFSTEGQKEMLQLTWALSRKYFHGKNLSRVFNIPGEPRIDGSQHFSIGSLNRAFQSRGSPIEFRHALRLAFLAGRCGTKGVPSPAAYATKWFTNDCVSFAANYSGVSPSTPVFGYAEGLSERLLSAPGVTPDVRLSAHLVHIPPRRKAEDIAQGDLLLTFAKPDSRGISWRHIAVVQDIDVGAGGSAVLSIAEWGWNIAADHTVRGKVVALHDGSKGDSGVRSLLKGVRSRFVGSGDLVCFNGTAPGPSRDPALRIFFDASRFADIESRGWMIAGQPAPH